MKIVLDNIRVLFSIGSFKISIKRQSANQKQKYQNSSLKNLLSAKNSLLDEAGSRTILLYKEFPEKYGYTGPQLRSSCFPVVSLKIFDPHFPQIVHVEGFCFFPLILSS